MPTVREGTPLACPGKPDRRLNVARHDDKTDASRLILVEDFVEPIQHDSFGRIVMKKIPASGHGDRERVNGMLVINARRIVFRKAMMRKSLWANNFP